MMKLFKHKTPKIGIALGSGAALGLAHIGVLKALNEEKLPIQAIAGTSIGAVIGACFAKYGEIDSVEKMALRMDWRQIARLLDLNINMLNKGLLNGQRVEKLLYSLIGDIEFKDLNIPFVAVATDVNTGKEIIINDGPVVAAIRASISIPGIFVPVLHKGKCLVDGGTVDPVPTDILRDMESRFIIAVNVLHERHESKGIGLSNKRETLQIPNILDTLIQSIYIMEHAIIQNRIPKADIIINPDTKHIEPFEFYKGKEAISAGYDAARNALPKIRELLLID